MGKKAITIAEQIEKLKNRGLQFDLGGAKAKEVLLDIGYYRLGFYWHPIQIDDRHHFKSATKFSNEAKIYFFVILGLCGGCCEL